MPSIEATEVERYMRSEANRLLGRDPSEFVLGLREMVDRVFMAPDDKNTSMLEALEPEQNTTIAEVTIDGVSCEWVYTEHADLNSRILYLHGGGMVAGSAATHRAMVSRISKRTGMVVLVPNYPLAPENPHPAALDGCVSVINWLHTNSPTSEQTAKHIFLAGDSAGGGLALSVLTNRQEQLTQTPTAAATFCALTDFSASSDSMVSNRDSDVLLSADAIKGLGLIYGGKTPVKDPNLSPLHGSITGLPPLHMQASDIEVLRDDSIRFFEKHKASGGEGELRIYSGMVHVWQSFAPYLPEANEAIDELADFFDKFK